MSFLRRILTTYLDGPQLDAFGKLRTSTPYTIFDSKQVKTPLIYIWDDQQTSGSGTTSTYNTNQASTTLSVSALTAGKRTRQTRRWFNYQPGKSQAILMTMVFGTKATGIKRRVGYFNDENGLFFEQTSSEMSVVRRTYTSGSAVDVAVSQSSWNLDKMDGTGKSGINLDFSKTQIAWIDFEWLGVGRVRFGWVVDGKLIYCHEMNHANDLSIVYMSTPNLPLRYEIENDGTGGASSLVHICSTVMSEGGEQDTGFPYGITRGANSMSTGNNSDIHPLFAIRLRDGFEGTTVRIVDLSLTCSSSSTYNFYLMLNPLLAGGATYTWATDSDSSVEYDNSIDGETVSGAEVNLFIGTSQQINTGGNAVYQLNTDWALGSLIDGTKDILVLGIQRATGANETFYGSLNYKELK